MSGPAVLDAEGSRRWLSTGAAVGGVAAAPGVGTGVAIAMSAAETVAFLEATALFALAVAETHGVRLEDVERRRTLLLAVLLGDRGPKLIEKIAGRTGKHWGKLLTRAIPGSSISSINKTLGRWFATWYGTKQGILVIGRVAPFGIGAAIGAGGNLVVGHSVIAGMRRAFGSPPVTFDAEPDGLSEDAPNRLAPPRVLTPQPRRDILRSVRATAPGATTWWPVTSPWC